MHRCRQRRAAAPDVHHLAIESNAEASPRQALQERIRDLPDSWPVAASAASHRSDMRGVDRPGALAASRGVGRAAPIPGPTTVGVGGDPAGRADDSRDGGLSGLGAMMLSERYLDEIRARWEAVRDTGVEIAAGPGGHARLLAGHSAGKMELRVRREGDPADDGDVLFVGHAFSDIPRLLGALASGSPLPAEDAGGIGMRIASASPGPWTAFIESEGGLSGSDVIRVSEATAKPTCTCGWAPAWRHPRLTASSLRRGRTCLRSWRLPASSTR